MSKSDILTLKDNTKWTEYLRANFSLLMNVYFTPEYYKIFEDNGDGIAQCFVYDDGSNIALYPFLLNKINDLGYVLDKTYYDIQGAYGYNGVIYASHEHDFIRSFYAEFYKYCKANNIIAEFTRFNPILKNEIFSREYLNVSFNRNIIYLDLSDNYSKIYSQYSSGIKSNLRKAKDNDLTVSVFYKSFPYKKEFIKMYIETMDSVSAEKYYYFSNKFFDGLFKNLPVFNFVVFQKENPIASIVCLLNKTNLHAFLFGYKSGYRSLRMNDFLFDAIIKYGSELGLKTIELGGGRSTFEDDSLLRFKEKYSHRKAGFYIGSRIYNKKIYNSLVRQWSEKYPALAKQYGNMVLKYRFLG